MLWDIRSMKCNANKQSVLKLESQITSSNSKELEVKPNQGGNAMKDIHAEDFTLSDISELQFTHEVQTSDPIKAGQQTYHFESNIKMEEDCSEGTNFGILRIQKAFQLSFEGKKKQCLQKITQTKPPCLTVSTLINQKLFYVQSQASQKISENKNQQKIQSKRISKGGSKAKSLYIQRQDASYKTDRLKKSKKSIKEQKKIMKGESKKQLSLQLSLSQEQTAKGGNAIPIKKGLLKNCKCCGKLIEKLCFKCPHIYCNQQNCKRKKKRLLNERMLERMKEEKIKEHYRQREMYEKAKKQKSKVSHQTEYPSLRSKTKKSIVKGSESQSIYESYIQQSSHDKCSDSDETIQKKSINTRRSTKMKTKEQDPERKKNLYFSEDSA